MKAFTYKKYIECIHTLRLNAVLQLAEESEEYKLKKNKKENNTYSSNELIKKTLKNKEEVARFINEFLDPIEKVKVKNLELYVNNSNISKFKTKEKEDNIVYKLNNKEIFFLIENQNTINYNTPYRILNSCIDIMQKWSRNKKIGEKTYYPIVVPIVIYTGKEKWTLPKNYKRKQIATCVFERYRIDLQYNLVDINKVSKTFLLQRGTILSYIMLIEKSKNENELIENLNLIIKLCKSKEKLYALLDIIEYHSKIPLEEKNKKDIRERTIIKISQIEKENKETNKKIS